MSNNPPPFKACAEARHKLEAAIKLAEGIHWLNGVASDQTVEPLREEFIEQLKGVARALGLELVERHPQPMGTVKVTTPIAAPPFVELNDVGGGP